MITDFDLLYRDARGVVRRRPRCTHVWGGSRCIKVAGHERSHYVVLTRGLYSLSYQGTFIFGPREDRRTGKVTL